MILVLGSYFAYNMFFLRDGLHYYSSPLFVATDLLVIIFKLLPSLIHNFFLLPQTIFIGFLLMNFVVCLLGCLIIGRFLFDVGCADYKYYEHRLIEEEKLLANAKEPQASLTGL